MNVAFFGVWSPDRLGHFLYDSTGRSLESFGPFIPESLDGVMLAKGHRIPGQVDMRFFKDHTVIAFEDRSGDARPGSNAVFIIEGKLNDRRQCWAEVEKHFPQIVSRVRAYVRMGDY